LGDDLVFVKLGGSLITDKTRAETARRDVIARLAAEVRCALDALPGLQLLLGHGSGSFGHWQANRYGTRDGVLGRAGWVGFARVSASAARLNQLVVDHLIESGVPVLAIRPSSSAWCRDGVLERLDTHPIKCALENGLVPLVHGDVGLDETRGGTIISTEELMAFLAPEFRPSRILLLGETLGVMKDSDRVGDSRGAAYPRIAPDTLEAASGSLGGARGPDVTGGMMTKVHQMLDLVKRQPMLSVHIISGLDPGLLTRVLLDPDVPVGTRIVA
jgi:isopentenyl phosphate kinase